MAKRFIQYFEDSFKENWDLPAMTNYETKQTFAYKDVAREIAKLHILFRELNISQGDKIALIGNNSPEWAITFLATMTYGAVIVPILQQFNPMDQENIINHSDAVLLFSDDLYAEKLNTDRMPNLRAIFDLSNFQCRYQQTGESVHLIIKGVTSNFFDKYPQGFGEKDVMYCANDENLMVLVYTSGTTGEAKGVKLCGSNFIVQTLFVEKYKIGGRGSKYLSYIPLAHTSGFVGIFLLAQGTHITFLPVFPSPDDMVGITRTVKPHYMVVVPLILDYLYKTQIQNSIKEYALDVCCLDKNGKELLRKKIVDLFGGDIRILFIGGASLNPEIESLFRNISIPYMIGYGMTETASQITANFGNVLSSVGKSVDGVEISIDSDDAINVSGEILIKGSNIMLGYYKNDDATKNIFTVDGWLKTGDMGVLDKEGNLYIKGRCKTMILTSSGQNVYPEAIEFKLNQSSFVSESVVVQDGNKIVAWIYPDYNVVDKNMELKDLRNLMDEVRKTVNKQLASFECIAEFIIHTTPFEKTPKKSIKRYLYEIKK